ncbi:universal stress protein [Rubrivirga litoralis]|uniref:Universal stress protein n=1 Tax=Rubrivirga litoralis TaxID=3075598 RepID=A0ABU3BLK7_9BACT|nr:universal stress protein [Rubrivirga sp. F394]MDT0630160.1 universal stress protein [Rubrivirga sp. F394]
MTRRILVALDPDSDTPAAIQTAIDIAKRHDAEVTGLAFVDREAIQRDTAGGGIGSMYFAERLRNELAEETKQKAVALAQSFGEQIEAAGVRHTPDAIREEGLVQSIVDEMRVHDLLIAGRESHFYYANPTQRTHTLAKVLEQSAAATLIVGTETPDVRRVAVAYDGSAAAARTLQKFAHLAPFGTDVDVEVVHVHGSSGEDRRASGQLLEGAASYLRAYGFDRVETTGVESGDPADVILGYATGERANLVVSGAYAKTGLRRLVFGSSATRLLDEARVPLFLYH